MSRGVALLCLVLVSVGCVKATPKPATAGDGPIQLTLPRFPGDAGVYSVESDRGSVVLLDVWATWCDPCRESLPMYQAALERHASEGLKVYAISIDAEDTAVEHFIATEHLTLPVLRDPSAAVIGPLLQVSMMPTSALVDRTGVVRIRHEGLPDDPEATLERDLTQLLARPLH